MHLQDGSARVLRVREVHLRKHHDQKASVPRRLEPPMMMLVYVCSRPQASVLCSPLQRRHQSVWQNGGGSASGKEAESALRLLWPELEGAVSLGAKTCD